MPFKSEAQRRFMWWKHPEIAEEWTKRYGSKPEEEKHDKKEKSKKRD